jgi:hypothetical protein
MRREDDLEATESDKISTKDRKAEPFSPQKDNAVLTLYPELRTVDHKPKQHVNPIDRALKHPCRPLQEIESLTKAAPPLHLFPSPAFSPQYATLQRGQEWNWLGS